MRFTCLVAVLALGCYESTPFEGMLPPRDSGVDARRTDTGPRVDASIDAFVPRDAPPVGDAGTDTGPGGDVCTGGETFVWVLGVTQPIVAFDGMTADGFDLDGRVSRISDPEGCFQEDFTSPDGTRGIDNQFAALIPTLEGFLGPLEILYFDIYFEGDPPVVIEARHVDDLRNDDCIDVLVHRARYDGAGPPRFEMIGYTPGQLFRSFESFRYARASINRRQLTAEDGTYPFVVPVNGTVAVNRLRNAQLRATVRGDQLESVVAGGAWDLEDAVESLAGAGDVPPDLVRSVFESLTDLNRDETGLCSALSVGIGHPIGVDGVLR